MVLDKLIVLDDVSGLANKSDELTIFKNFLNVVSHVFTFFILSAQAGKIGR